MDQNHLNNFERGPTKDHSCEVWSKSNQWFRRRCCLKIVDGRTDGRTYGRRRRRRTVSDHKSSPWAFSSGELKTKWKNSNVYEYWQQQTHFRSNGQIGASTGKLLISFLNEQNPHCYIHSTQYFPFFFFVFFFFFYFIVLPIAQRSVAKVWLWIIIKKSGGE